MYSGGFVQTVWMLAPCILVVLCEQFEVSTLYFGDFVRTV
jgi:hypothetical protein